jgi:hypothetical protein
MFSFIKDTEQLYWLFSSAVQGVAAFIALLMTGFAFVVNHMDNLELRDETLSEVHQELKSRYYGQLSWLAWISGGAIISGLVMMYVGPFGGWVRWIRELLFLPAIIAVVATIITGLGFIVRIIDPKKYEKVARQALANVQRGRGLNNGEFETVGKFMSEFAQAEGMLRRLYDEVGESISYSPQTRGAMVPLSRIASFLRNRELLTSEEYADLREIIRVRNLVVHGGEIQLAQGWTDRLRDLKLAIERARDRAKNMIASRKNDAPA